MTSRCRKGHNLLLCGRTPSGNCRGCQKEAYRRSVIAHPRKRKEAPREVDLNTYLGEPAESYARGEAFVFSDWRRPLVAVGIGTAPGRRATMERLGDWEPWVELAATIAKGFGAVDVGLQRAELERETREQELQRKAALWEREKAEHRSEDARVRALELMGVSA